MNSGKCRCNGEDSTPAARAQSADTQWFVAIKYLPISACLPERSHISTFIYITFTLLLHVLILAVCCQWCV